MRHVLAVLGVLVVGSVASGELIELAPPGKTAVVKGAAFDAVGVTVNETVAIHSIGLFFNPASVPEPPAFSLVARIIGSPPEELARSQVLTFPESLPLDWYDFPIEAVLEPGKFYVFTINPAPGSTVGGAVMGVFTDFSVPFAAGPITVANTLTPSFLNQLRVNATVIPEPSAWLLAATGLALLGLHRLSRSRWRHSSI